VATPLATGIPITDATAAFVTANDSSGNNGPNPELMRRLPFTLPDFTRISWSSDPARELWESRLRRITNAWIEIEWLAITHGVRSCCITVATPQQFLERGPRWAQLGLNALPIEMQGIGSSGYSATPIRAELGKPFVFRFVLGSPDHVREFKDAWDRGDNREIGRLLGYPTCCREFFQHVWVDQGLVDTTWPMAVASLPQYDASRNIDVKSLPQNNILWRWMGARAVSHLPCSFSCRPTIELADQFIEVGRQNGFDEEMNWLLEILSWPVEWSALHGIAEIKTPILKVSTRTDATPCKYVVRYRGKSYPDEGAQGLNFPYRRPSLPLLTESVNFKRGLENPIDNEIHPHWYAADNGFATVAAMDMAHAPIIKIANTVLAESSGPVLDLGCGNGALLKKIFETNPSIVPFGIDSEATRIAHAREILPQFAQNFILGNMCDSDALWSPERKYTLVILMPGRIVEAGHIRATRLRAWLRRCDLILVYAYDDFLIRYRGLKSLVAQAGLEFMNGNEQVGFAKAM
jgi:hypothetical protein